MAAPQIQRLAQMMRRTFSIKQGYDQNVLEDVFPTFELAGPVPADLRRSKGERLWCFFATVAASIGNTSTLLLNAPSGKLSVLEWIIFNGTTNLVIALTNLTVGAPIQVGLQDGRDNFATGGGTSFEGRTNIGLAAAGVRIPNASQTVFPVNFVMFGGVLGAFSGTVGRGLVLQGDAVNSAINVSGWGYERDLEPSEAL